MNIKDMYLLKQFNYKGYTGTIEYSEPDECYYGQISNTNDLVLYESNTALELYDAFVDAVDDYIILLKK